MELPHEVPVMTLPNVILFPHAMLPLFIFEPRYRRMIEDVLESHRMFCVAMQKPDATRESPVGIAGLGMVRACVKKKDGTSNLVLQGLRRVKLGKATRYKPYRMHKIESLDSTRSQPIMLEGLTRKLMQLLTDRLAQGFAPPLQFFKKEVEDGKVSEGPAEGVSFKEGIEFLAKMNEPEQLADLISCSLLPNPLERQTILETLDLESRLRFLNQFLGAEIKRVKRQNKNQDEV